MDQSTGEWRPPPARCNVVSPRAGFGATLTDFPHSVSHPDIDWSVFENAGK